MDLAEASRLLESSFAIPGLTLVGEGKEGYVFADEKNVYKVLRKGTAGISTAQIHLVREALGKDDDPPRRINSVKEIRVEADSVVIVTPRVDGERYVGGHWWEIVELLRECHSRKIALTNIHPDNFLVSARGLTFIDIGASILPLSEPLWTNMLKRAFLTFRCPCRDDLRALMAQSVTSDLPELDGFELLRHDAETTLPGRAEPVQLRRALPRCAVTLLIRTCHMEWATIEFQVEHLVRQLEKRWRFAEVVLVCDSNVGPFVRQYTPADPAAEKQVLKRLLDKGIVDRLLWAPEDGDVLRSVARRWFGCDVTDPYSARGEPTLASVWALDQCKSSRVLQTDSDILIGGPEGTDVVSGLTAALDHEPRAVSVSLPPPLVERQPLSGNGPEGKWRAEVRCSLVDRTRLQPLLPLPNWVGEGRLQLPWYRALDARLQSSDYVCLRGGEPSSFMLHVPNTMKLDRNGWYNIVKAVERGHCPRGQTGKIEVERTLCDWLGARNEDLVFVVRGRDVPLERLDRCLESLRLQRRQNFGVVFIDAGSRNGMAERLERELNGWLRGRASLYRNWDQSTIIENILRAIHELVVRPDTIVAMLDADDALLGQTVVDRILSAYLEGADLTVGSMLRTDRAALYPVTFESARSVRGSNVWQHLRTFRRHLFDRIREEDLQVDGQWIPYSEDWAYMLPMIEMARNPSWIQEPIYLYDPVPNRRNCSIQEREAMISKICQRPTYHGVEDPPLVR